MGSLRQVLAANIVRLRQARGWSQDALAFHVQPSRRYLARVEGAQASVGLDVIEGINSDVYHSDFFGVGAEWPSTSLGRSQFEGPLLGTPSGAA